MTNSRTVSIFPIPLGGLAVTYDEHYIFNAAFTEKAADYESAPATSLGQNIAQALQIYFNDPKYIFTLPLYPLGTPYQQSVWKALLTIPAGQAKTYGEVAAALCSGPRAIGQACRKNPIALFIPCHRVVGKAHHGGFMGRSDALKYKLFLLRHELFLNN